MTVEERNNWIIKNERFIHKVIQKYRYRFDYEDVIQEAFMGAITALDRIEIDKDDKLIRAYVAGYIEGFVKNNCIKKTSVVHIPRYAVDQGVKVTCLSIEWEYDGEDSYESMYLPYEETGYEEAEVMTDFMSAISKLSEKVQRTAILLAQGYERKDIAEMDHCSRQAINLRVKALHDAYRKHCA